MKNTKMYLTEAEAKAQGLPSAEEQIRRWNELQAEIRGQKPRATETESERKARCLKQSADVKRILGGYRAPKAKRQGMTAGQFMATFSNQGGVR